MTLRHFCTNCGATLQPGARACDNCGQTVSEVSPQPPQAHPVVPSRRSFPWWIVILGVGCIGIFCIAVIAVGGFAYFRNRTTDAPAVPAMTVVPITQTSLPATAAPATPFNEPTATASSGFDLSLTGDQHLDDHSLFDDFSSKALGWPVYDDGKTIIQYENEAYSFQIAEAEYFDWAYIPVDFIPNEIWFDVQGLPGPQDGTFGVFCQYRDLENHYYVEFDLETSSYIIAQYLDGEEIPLTKQNTIGQFWYETDAFKLSPEAVNRIGVSCYLEEITLIINDEMVDQVNVPQPLDQPGEAAFFVYTFDFAGPEGYKVFFDNVEVWQPLQ